MSDDQVHRYVARCAWRGSTGPGYRAYSRGHWGECPPARVTLPLSADPAFRGDPARLNPEQLVVLAASSCQLLSFLAEAARAHLDVVSYDEEAEGFMPEGTRSQRLTEIWLRPRITIAGDVEVEEVQALVERAHTLCYVASSLRTEVHVEAEVRLVPTETATTPAYAFGDSDAAARRLALVARVFEASSRAFLREVCPPRPSLSVDLGCGPGRSTRLLAEVSGAREVIGLDASPAHLARAEADAPAHVTFLEHDVTQSPWPTRQPELAYARFVLSHLSDPEGAVVGWAAQLAPGGVLALEDVEWIRSGNPVLVAYLRLAEDLLATRGAHLLVGPRLHALVEGQGWRQRESRLEVVKVSTATAAELFSEPRGVASRSLDSAHLPACGG